MNGFLIVVEGIDGAGKSTQARLLYDYLCQHAIDAVFSREPTDSVFGKKIRSLAIEGRESLEPEEEYQLFVEDRKLHVANVIKPALKAGKVVILDRYYYSTMAYQGALGLDPQQIRMDNEAFSPPPDLAVIIDIPVDEGLRRIRSRQDGAPDLFEKEQYLEKVARIFTELDDNIIFRVDGRASLQDVHKAIRDRVDPLLQL